MKEKGTKNDLFERLDNDSNFPLNQGVLKSYLEHPQRFAGAAVLQTEEYLHQVVEPRLEKYKTMLDQKDENIVNRF